MVERYSTQTYSSNSVEVGLNPAILMPARELHECVKTKGFVPVYKGLQSVIFQNYEFGWKK
jgi:hypothetical protein